MPRIPTRIIQSYIFGGRIRSRNCLRPLHTSPAPHNPQVDPPPPESDDTYVPLRKQIKDEIKRRKAVARDSAASGSKDPNASSAESLPDWELRVGIEIHAQLNTSSKLFSPAPTSPTIDHPNSQLAPFDLAIPGSLPVFQPATLIPALRAALALNCTIHRTSTFDRKHYFHWDQPAGYQLTQFYRPFATDGYITLYAHDGIAAEDGESVTIGIKQIQMEQDTAKTLTDEHTGTHLIDYSRVGVPLIEIITYPHLHHPTTAAALVRKIQTLLHSVDACILGMDRGGLRADVNVSVRPRPSPTTSTPLGQRTEIKNLSSHKSIRDAILAERARQIAVLSSGGTVVGETRGFSIGGTETRRLRAKEGEVDYRYMPDADVPPVIIGEDLIEHLSRTLGTLPDAEIASLVTRYGLSRKDALSLVALDGGARVEYFYDLVDELRLLYPAATPSTSTSTITSTPSSTQPTDAAADTAVEPLGKVAGNWVLHDLGAVAAASDTTESPLFDADGRCAIPARHVARIMYHVERGAITGASGKALLLHLFSVATRVEEGQGQGLGLGLLDGEGLEGERGEKEKGLLDGEGLDGERGEKKKEKEGIEAPHHDHGHEGLQLQGSQASQQIDINNLNIDTLIDSQNLWFKGLSDDAYRSLVSSTREERIVDEVLKKGEEKARGKIMYWVGRMVRDGGKEVDAKVAEGWVRRAVEEERGRRGV